MKNQSAILVAVFALAIPSVMAAQTVVATHTIRAKSTLSQNDIELIAAVSPGSLTDLQAALGMEARTILYQGRPIRPEDIRPPALVERNQNVVLVYQAGSLSILAEGRALDRGAPGDRVRVLNTSSRNAVIGIVQNSGEVRVQP